MKDWMHRKSSRLLRAGKNLLKTHVNTVAFMKIKQLFQRLSNKLRGEPELPDKVVRRLISRLENTREDELSCDEVFALVDVYAEASKRGEAVEKLMPLLRHHLDMCQECKEEYEALIRVLEGSVTS